MSIVMRTTIDEKIVYLASVLYSFAVFILYTVTVTIKHHDLLRQWVRTLTIAFSAHNLSNPSTHNIHVDKTIAVSYQVMDLFYRHCTRTILHF